MEYRFQLRHLPTNGFVRSYIRSENWSEYYIAPMGTSGVNMTNEECKEALKQLCDDTLENPYMLQEFILIRVPI